LTRRLWLAALAVLATLAALAPASAGAKVQITRSRVVVTSSRGKAVMQRSRVRIAFLDSKGQTVLKERPNGRPGSTALPPTDDPEAFSLERQPDHAVYSPISYEVGTEQREQWNNGNFTADTLFDRRSGTIEFAHDVLSARRSGRGARLVLSTSERGRRLVLTVDPDEAGGIRVRISPSRKGGVITMGDSFSSGPREAFHGFGGRHGSVNLRGQKLYGNAEQENLGGSETLTAGLALLPTLVDQGTDHTLADLGGAPNANELPGGPERYLFPNGAGAAYYPQAEFVSSRGYGFLLNQTQFSRWRMANDRPDAWQVQASAPKLDYTVVFGPGTSGAVSHLTNITGRHRLPPAWAQGPILWREVQVPALPGLPAPETAASYRAHIEQDLAEMQTYGVHPSAYAFEGWALLGDLDYVRSVIARLRGMGVRVVLYHRAYVSHDSLNTQPAGDFEQTMAQGLVAKDASGAPFVFGSNGGSPATLLDFTNPATRRWWKQRLIFTLKLGMDGFMQDFGEQTFDGMHFHNGADGRAMHNRYSVIWSRVTRRILDNWSAKHPKRGPIWFFTRNGFSGRPGSAAYEMGNFPGDETVDWGAASGLRSLAPDMLNRAVGGAYGFTTDIGGYADFLTGPPSEELFDRWTEWSALTPYFRVHNSASSGTRMPWSFGPSTLALWKATASLHDHAIPLIRRLWKKARRTGIPVTRPMWLSAPEAPNFGDDQQWMLGRDVLVAPVVEKGATTKRVALPAGCWADAATKRRSRGPGSVEVPAPPGVLPYFTRCGTHPFRKRVSRARSRSTV
jgi:sulfoquinovosidase